MKKISSNISAGGGKVSMNKIDTNPKTGGDHDHNLKIKTKGADGSKTTVSMKSSRKDPKGK